MTSSSSTSSRSHTLTGRRRRLALATGATLLAAALGTSAGAAQPSPAPGAGAEPPTVAGIDDRPQSIDDEVMRHRMIHEKPTGTRTATDSDLTRVTEEDAGTGSRVRSAEAQRLPSSPTTQKRGIRIDGTLDTTVLSRRRSRPAPRTTGRSTGPGTSASAGIARSRRPAGSATVRTARRERGPGTSTSTR